MATRQRETRELTKVGITFANELPYLLGVDLARPIKVFLEDICAHYRLQNPDDYALQFSTTQRFVTDQNRSEIQNGIVMKLTYSPAKTAKMVLDSLKPGNEANLCSALKQLSEFSLDNTFTQEFINITGLQEVIQMIQGGKYTGEIQAYLLKSFVELMDHGLVSWDILDTKFINTVANCINTRVTDATTLQSALEILESIVLHSSEKYSVIEREVSASSLIPHLQSTNSDVKKNAVALINALFLKADSDKRKKIAENLQSKSMRSHILDEIIRGQSVVMPDMAHQLYVLQSLLFSLLDEKRNTPADINDQTVQSNIQELRQVAFDSDPDSSSSSKRQSHLNEFKKLGFKNQMNPAEDFVTTPPGLLALSCMMYFAKNHSENYTKVVLENSCRGDNHDLPFAVASRELTIMLCEILKVGDPPDDDGQTYYAMFFTHDHSFEEFYCICVQLLNKTWKEMKATNADFNKVFAVVREQIVRALTNNPQGNFDSFRQRLSHLTYQDIVQLWQQDRRNREELESQAKPIVELREQIMPDILELIKKQRLNYLVEGTRFTTKVARRQDKFFYCRLSPNHKVFHYGDCEENASPSIEQLPNKLAVVDIKELLIGKDCPHIKDKKKVQINYAFTIQPEEPQMNEPINFVAPSEDVYNIWIDGINALLGKKMGSDDMKHDLETLLSMEVKLRLLDTEGIRIPDAPPLIPKEPPNYDFVFRNL